MRNKRRDRKDQIIRLLTEQVNDLRIELVCQGIENAVIIKNTKELHRRQLSIDKMSLARLNAAEKHFTKQAFYIQGRLDKANAKLAAFKDFERAIRKLRDNA